MNEITYLYIYTLEGREDLGYELEIPARLLETHEMVMPFIKPIIAASFAHVYGGTFAFDITLGVCRIQIIRK